MSTLIIPDIHHQISKLDLILKKESFDKCILLGDEFDSFIDAGPEFAIKTAEYLLKILQDDRFILLYGNHTLNYLGDNPNMYCSGFTRSKRAAIREIIKENNYKKWKWFHFEDNIMFSHAGLTKPLVNSNLFNEDKINIELLNNHLNYESKKADKTLKNLCNPHWFMNVGFFRGGYDSFGGLVWCDIKEFKAVNGLSQIFGHTPNSKPRLITSSEIIYLSDNEEIILDGTNNVCLDTHLNHYGILNGNKLTIKAYKDL